MATLAELQAELLQFQVAYKELVLGNRSTKLVVGTGSSRREYGYQEINEKLLLGEINRLKDEIAALTPEADTSFKPSFFRIAWSKH